MELCARLPWWEGWLGPLLGTLVVVSSAAAAFEAVRLRARRRLRDEAAAHWTERARITLEFKSFVLPLWLASIGLSILLGVQWVSASGCSRTAGPLLLGCAVFTALGFRTFGAIDAGYRGTVHSLAARIQSLMTLVIVLQPSLLVALVASALGSLAPRDGLVWGWVGIVAALHVVAGTGVLYGLTRIFGLSWPARDEVRRAVERAQTALPTPIRSVDELAWLMPNAVAFPLAARVAFTKAAAEHFSSDELYAIALHEVGHLNERAIIRWMRPLQSLVLLPYSVGISLVLANRVVELGVIFALSLALAFAINALSRRLETHADAHAADHAAGYARALERLYRMAGVPAVLSKQATHPSLYDRMVAAGITPDFSRPKPPRRFLGLVVLPAFLLLNTGLAFGTQSVRNAVRGLDDREKAALLRVAFQGKPSDLVALARETEDERLADLLIERALSEDPDLFETPATMK